MQMEHRAPEKKVCGPYRYGMYLGQGNVTLELRIDSIDNDSRVRVLGIIDKLGELGVSERVSLPQVREHEPVFKLLLISLKPVVVGD